MFFSTGFEIYTRHSLPCRPLVSTLPSFNHQGYTDGGVDLQPAKECLQKTLGEKNLADACYWLRCSLFLLLVTNPFKRKCQNIMKANEFRKCPAMALQRLDDATVPRLGAAGPQRCCPAVGRTGRGLLGLCRVSLGLRTT